MFKEPDCTMPHKLLEWLYFLLGGYPHLNGAPQETTIDLVFVSANMRHRALVWQMATEAEGFSTDHHIGEAKFDIKPYRSTRIFYDFSNVDEKEFKTRMGRALQADPRLNLQRPLSTPEETQSFATALESVTGKVYVETMPLQPPCPPRTNPSNMAHARNFRELARAASAQVDIVRQRQPSDDAQVQYWSNHAKVCNSHANYLEKTQQSMAFRKRVASQTRTRRGLYSYARMGARLCKPRQLPHLPTFIVDGKKYETGSEKADAIMKELFGDPGTEPIQPTAKPSLSPERTQYESVQDLREGEVSALIKKSKLRKAAGMNEVTNDALKMVEGIILPYLEHLFRACLKLSIHPAIFKKAKLVMFRKEG